MKSIQFDRPGEPSEVLALRDAEPPTPGRGEVGVRMILSPVNPSDLLYIRGRYPLKPKFPGATPGFEGVGVVESNGGGVLGWLRRGKRCLVLNDRHGNWQQNTVALAKQAIPVPDWMTNEQAATFFVNPATALVMTRTVLGVPRGAWLLQSAAGSALGKMIIRLAKLDGYKTINVVRRPEQVEELKRLGADVVLVEADGDLAERVRAITGGGVGYAIDPVGGATGSAVVEALGPNGRAVLFGLLSGEPVTIDPRALLTGCKTVEGFWLADWSRRQNILTMLRLIRTVTKLIRRGVLATEAGEVFSMDRIGAAVEAAERPGRAGKVLLRLDSP